MNKLRVILTFIHQSSIAKWMFIVRKKNKLSQDWIFITVRIHPMSAIKGELITKLYMNWPERITYDLSICYPYKHDCYSMCDLKIHSVECRNVTEGEYFQRTTTPPYKYTTPLAWTVTEELMCCASTLTVHCTYLSGIAPELKPSVNIKYSPWQDE